MPVDNPNFDEFYASDSDTVVGSVFDVNTKFDTYWVWSWRCCHDFECGWRGGESPGGALGGRNGGACGCDGLLVISTADGIPVIEPVFLSQSVRSCLNTPVVRSELSELGEEGEHSPPLGRPQAGPSIPT